MADTPEVPETPPTPPPPPRKKWRRGVVILLLTIIAIPVLIFSLWVWVTLGYVYSTGERAGYVQKLSKKGWLCKTWEGELAMVPIPGTLTPQIFNFTVRSDSLAKVLELAPQKPLDHLMVMNMCGRGDKDIFTVAEHLGSRL